ncbi:MAG: HprK-related kinase A [Propionivibrio sp.]|nr:HprK-related kinase A [Propionivibrio sp.]
MLTLSDTTFGETLRALRSGTFRLQVGCFSLKVSSDLPTFAHALRTLYETYPVSLTGGAYHYDIGVNPPSLLRRHFRRNVTFSLSGDSPFQPMAVEHAHAMFEWGLNWTIGSYEHDYLILHSAVVEKMGLGVLISATSGSGKSTLAAELALHDWRLLSDEMALIDSDLRLIPCARPISLKNQSIDVIRHRHPGVELGPVAHDTHKGTIAHLPAPRSSVLNNRETAAPRLIVFPRWSADSTLRLEPVGSGQAAMRLIDQSFNYSLLGREGFERLTRLVDTAEAWSLEYASLDDARNTLERLVNEVA